MNISKDGIFLWALLTCIVMVGGFTFVTLLGHNEPVGKGKFTIVVIGGCEYLTPKTDNPMIIHKANCTNIIHGHER